MDPGDLMPAPPAAFASLKTIITVIIFALTNPYASLKLNSTYFDPSAGNNLVFGDDPSTTTTGGAASLLPSLRT